MRRTIITALSILLAFGVLVVPADAHQHASDGAFIFDGPDATEPAPTIPLDWIAVPMWGDVWANGTPIGPVDFVLFWQADDESEAQLWALWQGQPVQVCTGQIFDTPQGEPIFFGEATTPRVDATCHMARTPDYNEISLFIADADGQWATAIMTDPAWQQTDAASIFG